MSCSICKRAKQWHGSDEYPAPGTYLSEMGCHDGVRMDDDEYHEGWAPDTVYPPCQYNPARCKTCKGTGTAPPAKAKIWKRDDCADCEGTGWKGGKVQWPESVEV